MPNFYRIQLHPAWGKCAVEFAEGVLKHVNAIGLDFDRGIEPSPPKSLDQWTVTDFEEARKKHKGIYDNKEGTTAILSTFHNLKKNDIVLVHGGAKPVALVEITGNYFFEPEVDALKADPNPDCAGKDPVYWDWFRHRFPIKVIGWYSQDKLTCDALSKLSPPAQGTFQPLKNENGKTLKLMKLWINLKKQDEIMENQVNLLTSLSQIILAGPPGTSKTFEAKRLAASILGLSPESATNDKHPEAEQFKNKRFSKSVANQDGAWAIVQFHPAYNYEDFVRGIQVSTSPTSGSPQYSTENRIFAQMALAASKNKDEKYVLIIDEINRAHLAAVLGELIYGLEYRDSKITSPYAIDDPIQQFDNDPNALIVPPNLYIIGTMNTADRSIGHIDYAVRRRFAFVTLLPDESVLDNYYKKNNHSHASKAKELFQAVKTLFSGENNCLSPEFHTDDVQPGHTYFMADSDIQLADKFIYQVYPLLREYVKDGILVKPDDSGIKLKNINIEPVMPVSELEKVVKNYLNCLETESSIDTKTESNSDIQDDSNEPSES